MINDRHILAGIHAYLVDNNLVKDISDAPPNAWCGSPDDSPVLNYKHGSLRIDLHIAEDHAIIESMARRTRKHHPWITNNQW